MKKKKCSGTPEKNSAHSSRWLAMSLGLYCSDMGPGPAQHQSGREAHTDGGEGWGGLWGLGTVTPGSGCPGPFWKDVTKNSNRDTNSFSLHILHLSPGCNYFQQRVSLSPAEVQVRSVPRSTSLFLLYSLRNNVCEFKLMQTSASMSHIETRLDSLKQARKRWM